MVRSITIVIMSFVLCSWAAVGAQQNPPLIVVVYNDAGVSAAVIESAKGTAERIYRATGIRIAWKDHSDASAGDNQFFVRILPQSLNLPGEDFGVAFVGNDGRGVQADIFHSGIERLAADSSLGEAEIMGHVIAHELGHLLLGMNSHSRAGIMQAHWTDRQLRQMSMGTLRFDKCQSKIIEARMFGGILLKDVQEQKGY